MSQNEFLNRSEWQQLIITQLDRIEARQVADGNKLYDLHGQVSRLKAISSIFGLAGGVIAAVLTKLGLH